MDLKWSIGDVTRLTPDDALQILSSLGGRYFNIPPYHDEPKLFHLACVFKGEIDDPGLGRASGTSWSFERAATKALGETVERLSAYPDQRLLSQRPREAASLGPNTVTLQPHILPFARPGHEPSDRDRVRWVAASLLAPDPQPAMVPAQLVYLPYEPAQGEPVWYLPTSNGLAAGQTKEHAAINGILEVLERDALMRFWAEPSSARPFDLSKIDDPESSGLVAVSERYLLSVDLYQLHTRGGFATTVLCVLRDTTGIGPPSSLGLKASLSPWAAVRGAIEEAHQLRPWLRELQTSAARPPAVIRTIDERASWWLGVDAQDELRIRLASCSKDTVQLHRHHAETTDLGSLVTSLMQDGITTWIAPIESANRYFSVCRAILPEVSPIVFDESYQVALRGQTPSGAKSARHPLL